MKIGCCLNMHTAQQDGTGAEWIDTAVRSGYDYIELPLAQMMTLPEPAFRQLVQRVSGCGILCEVCNNFLSGTLKMYCKADQQVLMEYAKATMERMSALRARTVVFGSGGARQYPLDMAYDAAFDRLAEFLHQLVGILEQRDITLVIEPLRVRECNIINSLEEAAQLMDNVGHPRIRLLSDNYHMAFSGELPEVIRYWPGKLSHAHLCRVEGRVMPTGVLTPDEDAYIRELALCTSCSRISVEAYSRDFDWDSRNALPLIRQAIASVDAAAPCAPDCVGKHDQNNTATSYLP